jgi:anti-anti-sigma factor
VYEELKYRPKNDDNVLFLPIFAQFNDKNPQINITMNTNITEKDGKYVVALEGELDTAHALEVEQAMQPLHELSGKDITIDCTKLEYIASSGLRILLGLLKNAKAKENHVVLKNLNDEIKEVFKMTGFIDLFNIE